MRTGPLVGLVALVMCGPLACGGGGGGGSDAPTGPSTPSTPITPITPPSPSEVTVQNNSFSPATVTIAAGTTVTWTWDTCTSGYDPYTGSSTTCVDHAITWDAPGGTDSATQSKGTYQRNFATAGTYNYHCAIHGAAMSGKVIVQ